MKQVFAEAKWIGSGVNIVDPNTDYLSPALQLRKVFTLPALSKSSALCRICGVGVYVLYINGQRVGDDVLSPAFTAYDKRVLFVEYDVTPYLREGDNVVAIKLGDGFYNQTTKDVWGFYYATWRNSPRAIFELIVDGDAVCVSDNTWQCTVDGATIHSAIRTGEYYDARKEDAWKEVGYMAEGWPQAAVVAAPGGTLSQMTMPPIRECESLAAVKMWQSKNGWVFDFGKNIAGYVRLMMQGNAGDAVELRYAERLDGLEIDQENIKCYVEGKIPYSVDKYIFKGDGVEVWKPEFVYHGFRYVEVVGLKNEPPMSGLNAYFVHTDVARKGAFDCSDELLSWIYDAGIRSFLSNYHGFPEDCPHREKNGWTGDAAISCDYAVALFDMKEAYKKWLTDIGDAQRPNGQLPGIVPTCGWGFNWGSGPAWDAALLFLPYALYKETGDEECLLLVEKWVDKYLTYAHTRSDKGLVCFGLSDWCPPANIPDLKLMSNQLSDSCYYYKMQCIASEIALLSGKIEKANAYRKSAEYTLAAIREKYIHGDSVDNDCQGALAEVLYFHIVEGEQAKAIAAKLAETVRLDEYKFKVGILGMKALLNALSEYGYTEDAYKMVARYDYPSYGRWKELGATTLWESWLGGSIYSCNHHMYSDVVHWLFRHIGGLQNAGIGYDKCILKPYFFAENCSASVTTETRKGKLSFAWEKTGDVFTAELLIPEGIEAILILPSGGEQQVKTGKLTVS